MVTEDPSSLLGAPGATSTPRHKEDRDFFIRSQALKAAEVKLARAMADVDAMQAQRDVNVLRKKQIQDAVSSKTLILNECSET